MNKKILSVILLICHLVLPEWAASVGYDESEVGDIIKSARKKKRV